MAKKTESPPARRPPAKSKEADDFVSVARRLECDEDKGRFEKKLGKIARAKPVEARKG